MPKLAPAPVPAEVRATKRNVLISTSDGFQLSGTVFHPVSGRDITSLLVTTNATGVQARFYHDFCRWSASHGVLAVSFDYRYSGESFPPYAQAALQAARAKGDEDGYKSAYDAALRQCPEGTDLTGTWARKDLAAAVVYARRLCAELVRDRDPHAIELTILGHSLGGHLHVTLDPSFVDGSDAASSSSAASPPRRRVHRFMTVCSGNAHWRNHPSLDSARFAMEEFVAKPLVREGLFRSSNLGLGFDLPLDCGREWLEWYFHPLFSLVRPENEHNARANTRSTPFGMFAFVDDITVGPDMMRKYLETLDCSSGNVQSLRIDPNELDSWPRLAHVNSFQPGNGTGYVAPERKLASSDLGEEDSGSYDAAGGQGEDVGEERAPRGGEAYLPNDPMQSESQRSSSSSLSAYEQLARSTLTRQETIWPIYLAWITRGGVLGEQQRNELGEYKLWTNADECDRDALRAQEVEARQDEERQGRRGYLTSFAEDDEEEEDGEDQANDEEDRDDGSDAKSRDQQPQSPRARL